MSIIEYRFKWNQIDAISNPFYIHHVDLILDDVAPCNIDSFNFERTTNWFWTENEKKIERKKTHADLILHGFNTTYEFSLPFGPAEM